MLARRGADVCVVARRIELLETLSAEIEGLGQRCVVVPADVADPDQVSSAFERILQEIGNPDILVNAAGIAIWKPFLEVTYSEHQAMMDVNYWGAFNWIRAVLPGMKERRRGYIVNISSGTGKIALSATSGYSASKFALTGLSEALHREFLGTKLGISCLHPGNMKTNFWNEEAIPRTTLPPIIRFAPRMSPNAVARSVGNCIQLGIPVRLIPIPVGILIRANALWIRFGDLMLWTWFIPLLVLGLVLLLIF